MEDVCLAQLKQMMENQKDDGSKLDVGSSHDEDDIPLAQLMQSTSSYI